MGCGAAASEARRGWIGWGTGLLIAVAAPIVHADYPERLDHRGSVGLAVDLGAEYADASPVLDKTAASPPDSLQFVAALTGSYGLPGGNEVLLGLDLLRGPTWGGALFGGYRMYRGREEWKSFIDLGLKIDTMTLLHAPAVVLPPGVTDGFELGLDHRGTIEPVIGPAVDVGLLYELSPVLSAFVRLGGSAELGLSLRLAVSASLGIQGRSYLFE